MYNEELYFLGLFPGNDLVLRGRKPTVVKANAYAQELLGRQLLKWEVESPGYSQGVDSRF